MSTKQLLIKELDAAIKGNPWHGASLKQILNNITSADAVKRPIPNAHSIAELVLHILSWTEEVAERMEGKPPSLPSRGDWPVWDDLNAEKWNRIVSELLNAHQELLNNISDFPDESFGRIVGNNNDASLGTGITFTEMLHGLAQHHAYHAGQIALLSKFN
ncbi:DinB family protein [Solitalea sp. MAHUQ-68]|uniref:DinB family protein n=1 Tax=Solitalea agri TaxID=2953739 RepID=A0A9X2FAB4_9SPHI|nr:DinB family protein [Solitalea agri]MCO4293263.1 DinB family protein [Solitalea agri]